MRSAARRAISCPSASHSFPTIAIPWVPPKWATTRHRNIRGSGGARRHQPITLDITMAPHNAATLHHAHEEQAAGDDRPTHGECDECQDSKRHNRLQLDPRLFPPLIGSKLEHGLHSVAPAVAVKTVVGNFTANERWRAQVVAQHHALHARSYCLGNPARPLFHED